MNRSDRLFYFAIGIMQGIAVGISIGTWLTRR